MKSSRYYHGNKKLKKRKPEYYIENDNKRRKIDKINKSDSRELLETVKSYNTRDNYERVTQLIKKNVNINFQDKDGNTALMFASYNKNLNIVKLLLNNGANPNLQDKNGNTVLINNLENFIKNQKNKESYVARQSFFNIKHMDKDRRKIIDILL